MACKSTYSDRKILNLPSFQVSYGVLGRLFKIQDTNNVPPAVRVLSPAWAPRGFHRAMFMNSVSHGKAWIKNAASPLKKPCFAKECMFGGYLSKNLSSPPPPPHLSPSKLPIRTHSLLSKNWAVGGEGVEWAPKSRTGREVLCHMVSPPPPTNQTTWP